MHVFFPQTAKHVWRPTAPASYNTATCHAAGSPRSHSRLFNTRTHVPVITDLMYILCLYSNSKICSHLFISPLSLDVWIYMELETHSKWLASCVIRRFPFCIPGVSILFKKPMKKPPNLFSFLSPLSLDVWIYMAAAYLGVSVLLFILAR